MASIFAGAIHDVDHPGLQSSYLINTDSPLALLYNDEAVLEQHHLSVGFKLLQNKNCDFVESLPRNDRQQFRKLVIQMVLATDMRKHGQMIAALKTTIEAEKIKGVDATQILEHSIDRDQILQNLIHLADLSNPMKPFDLYNQWTTRLMEEYWAQGDLERAQGFKVSALCDRHDANIPKSQLWFIDFIVHPLCEIWTELVGGYGHDLTVNLAENRDRYIQTGQDSPPPSAAGNDC